ncbi:MAG: hypothetical protein H6733_07880 [Alphaproteobacteria bacterium]|nr:hypothetical protein [Alphaproteobacteria bacterium]
MKSLTYTLRSEGARRGIAREYIVDPMTVWQELRKRRPDVSAHIERHYHGDGYQQIKVWVPKV